MWDTLIHPIRDHLPLWLMLLPVVSAACIGVASRVHPDAVRRAMQIHWLLSAGLSLWLITAYDPVKPASSREAALRLGPIERFQFRDSFGWVGETRSVLMERATRRGDRRTLDVTAQWGPDIRFDIGADGLSIWFVALSVLLLAVGSVEARSAEREVRSDGQQTPHFALRAPRSPLPWLWLQSSLVGTFVSLDVVLFVVCWMSTLLAVAWLVGVGSDSQRQDVLPRLLKQSWLAGWLVALGLSGLVLAFGWVRISPEDVEAPLVFSIPEIVAGIGQGTGGGTNAYLWGTINVWPFWLLVSGFSLAIGLAPWHRPFVEALAASPRGVAIVLVGVSLKVGLYGWLRFVVPLFPDLLREHADLFSTLVGLSSLFAAALAFGERDWHRRIALATCSSAGLSLLGVLTLTIEGLTGGVLRMLSHGLTAALLVWLLPGKSSPVAPRQESQTSNEFCLSSRATLPGALGGPVAPRQGYENAQPQSPSSAASRWRVALVRFALFAWIGLPGLSGFVAEFLTPFGLFQRESNGTLLSLLTSGLIAWTWVRAEREPLACSTAPWRRRESVIAAILVALNVVLGVCPHWTIDRMQPTVLSLLPAQTVSEGH